MFILMILFIALIFTAIFASFTYFMNDYIRRDMTSQLELAVQDIEVRYYFEIMMRIPQIVSHQAVQVDGEIFYHRTERVNYRQIVTMIMQYIWETNSKSEVNLILYGEEDYRRLFPDENFELLNLSDMDNLMKLIEANKLTEANKIYKTYNSYGSYYLTNMNLGGLFGELFDGVYIAFYISTEKYDEFIANIYFMLLVILTAATVFTLIYVMFISRSISKPIKKLCGFADEMGRGNFRRNEYAFKDRELIDLNRRMNETARRLEINDEDQKIFFQNVSHELKTPLMSIKGYAEGIKYGIFSSENEKSEASNIIIEESDRLNDLVVDLLYISKMDSSKHSETENFISASLGAIIENCADKLRGVLIGSQNNGTQAKNIKINHPKHDIFIKCDEENLMRAIMNITANCLRYAKTTVYIDYHGNGGKIILNIKDDGEGIEEQDLPNIFKRFYKGKGGKHGIGLSIAKTIIEQHGAKIFAGNREECPGAEFIIEFNHE